MMEMQSTLIQAEAKVLQPSKVKSIDLASRLRGRTDAIADHAKKVTTMVRGFGAVSARSAKLRAAQAAITSYSG